MIQIVVVKWGTLYDHRHINGMIDAIRSNTKEPLRIVAITDEPAGFYDDIIVQPFPDLGLPHTAILLWKTSHVFTRSS